MRADGGALLASLPAAGNGHAASNLTLVVRPLEPGGHDTRRLGIPLLSIALEPT